MISLSFCEGEINKGNAQHRRAGFFFFFSRWKVGLPWQWEGQRWLPESSQLAVLLQGHFVIDTSCQIYGSWDQDITIDNWWPVSTCVRQGDCEFMDTCAHVHACILTVWVIVRFHSLPPPSPHHPCLSVMWASDWGPRAQSPRKLH